MVPELARRLGPAGRYVGFDVHAPSIRWCRERYAADPRLSFDARGRRLGLRLPQGSAGGELSLPDRRRIAPISSSRSRSSRTCCAPDAAHYLSEIRRVLEPGRRRGRDGVPLRDAGRRPLPAVARAFPCGGADGLVRWRSAARPTAAVAYAKSHFVAHDRGRGPARPVDVAGLLPRRRASDRAGHAAARAVTRPNAAALDSDPMPAPLATPPLARVTADWLGRIDYDAALGTPARGGRAGGGRRPGARCFLLEHEPVFTLGRNAEPRRHPLHARALPGARRRGARDRPRRQGHVPRPGTARRLSRS